MDDDHEDREDQDGVAGQYNDGNRAFLQAFLARGTLTLKEAKPVLAAIFSAQEGRAVRAEQVTQEDFESYVSAASAAVSLFDLEIRSANHQVRRERVWAVVNTMSDGLTQLATLHSADEIAFVKRVIDAMFERYNTPRIEAMCIDEMQANKLRVPPKPDNDDGGEVGEATVLEENGDADAGGGQTQQVPLKGLKSSEVETVMRSMVDEGWFERTSEGFYHLSARALLELRSWLLESYNDPDAEEGEWQRVKFCEACKDVVTIGQRCAERDCLVRLHDKCAESFFRRRERDCPKCSLEWTGRHFVGERAVTETEAYQRGRRRSGKAARHSNVAEEVIHEEPEEEEEVEEEDDE
ncbi:Nse1 non-SMC component of SMC5-6 complex-domain-containing protein [Astrocystis sublimbata]|nr:Nse1 non-SMC component of SMC5-6 complex-domain-containing protein [Astrocystis sublimbata]